MRYQYGCRSPIHGALRASIVSTAAAFAVTASGGQDWSEIETQTVSAEDMLSADVTSAGGRVIDVKNLVLSADGSGLQYILYEMPYPHRLYQVESGFTTFDAVDVFGRNQALELRFVNEQSPQAPETIELTASEADHRLLTSLLNDQMHFTDGEAREVVDLLIDRESGDVTHFVVAMDDTLFDLDRRAIPASMVSFRQNRTLSASTDLAGVDEIAQEYDQS